MAKRKLKMLSVTKDKVGLKKVKKSMKNKEVRDKVFYSPLTVDIIRGLSD